MKGRVARGAMWLGVTRAALNLLGFISTIVLARLLSPADFGLVAIATSIFAIAMSLTELSLSSALIHRQDLEDDHFHSVWTISLIRSGIIAVFFCLAAYPLAHFYHEPRLTAVLVAIGLTGALSGLDNPKIVGMSKRLIFWQEFVVQVSQRFVALITSIVIAVLYRSYWAMVIGNFAGTCISIIASYAIAPYLPKLRLTQFRELFRYSFWLSMGDSVNTLNWRFDQLVLGYFVGNVPLGIYSVADDVSSLPVREATLPLTKTLFPAFATLADDRARLRDAYQRAQAMLCAIAFPVGFGFAVIAQPVILLVMGAKWAATVPVIQILSGTFALQALSVGVQPLAMAKGETRLLFNRDIRTFAIRIPFVAGGLWVGGMMGVVVGRAISSLIGTVWNMDLVRTISGISLKDQLKVNMRPLLAVVAMLVATIPISVFLDRRGATTHFPIVSAAVLVVVGALVYVTVLILLWLRSGRPVGPESEIVHLVSSRSIRPMNLIGAVLRGLRFGHSTGIISQEQYARRHPDRWSQAVPAQQAIRRPPRRLGSMSVDFEAMLRPFPALGVLVLSQGRVMGERGWAFTSKGKLIRETTWYGEALESAGFPISFLRPKKIAGVCLSLVSEAASINYGHYVLDSLPRLGIAEGAGWDLSKIDHVYLFRPPSKSAALLVQALGVRPEQCIWVDEAPCIQAEQLLVTTFPGTRRNYARIVPDTLQRPFKSSASIGRRVYIPRNETRVMVNREEIEGIIGALGIETYDFRTCANEPEFFQSAELVVGAHGAGLTNIAFCRPGTKVLEIVPSDHVYPYFYTLAESAQLDYSYLVGKSINHRPAGSFGPSPYDFWLDPEEFRRSVELLLTESTATA